MEEIKTRRGATEALSYWVTKMHGLEDNYRESGNSSKYTGVKQLEGELTLRVGAVTQILCEDNLNDLNEFMGQLEEKLSKIDSS
jgi:hypothetical protein